MRVPRLVWNERHHIASLDVSFSGRIWDTREIGDLLLGYNAGGRLARVIFLAPHRCLPAGCDTAGAIETAMRLLATGEADPRDLQVLASAHARARTSGQKPPAWEQRPGA